jgi:hypothetical protein
VSVCGSVEYWSVEASECQSVRMSEHRWQSVGSVKLLVAELPSVDLGVTVSEHQSQSIDCRSIEASVCESQHWNIDLECWSIGPWECWSICM